MYFRYFVIISPWKRAWPFIWTNLNNIPTTQGWFTPSLVEIGPVHVVLEKKISNFRQCIFAVSEISPLGKGRIPSVERTWIPITQGCFVLGRKGWNLPSGSGEDKNVKSLPQLHGQQRRRRRRTTKKLWSGKLTETSQRGEIAIFTWNKVGTKFNLFSYLWNCDF